MFGDKMCAWIGQPVPAFYQTVQEKKWMAMGVMFFVPNMITQSLLSTGAFEIYVEGVEAFSKLKTGRMPEMNDMKTVMEMLR